MDIEFNMTPEMSYEVDRIMKLTGLRYKSEVFQRAFSLLRIHVDAAINNQKIIRVDAFEPDDTSKRYTITLPFFNRD